MVRHRLHPRVVGVAPVVDVATIYALLLDLAEELLGAHSQPLAVVRVECVHTTERRTADDLLLKHRLDCVVEQLLDTIGELVDDLVPSNRHLQLLRERLDLTRSTHIEADDRGAHRFGQLDVSLRHSAKVRLEDLELHPVLRTATRTENKKEGGRVGWSENRAPQW